MKEFLRISGIIVLVLVSRLVFAQPSTAYAVKAGGSNLVLSSQSNSANGPSCTTPVIFTVYGFNNTYAQAGANCGVGCTVSGTSQITIVPGSVGTVQTNGYYKATYTTNSYPACGGAISGSALQYSFTTTTYADLVRNATAFPSTICSTSSTLTLSNYITISGSLLAQVQYTLDGFATSSTFNPATVSAGAHTLQATYLFSNGSTTVTIGAFTLYTALSGVTNPDDQALCASGTASFSSAGSGSGVTFQWQESSNGGASWSSLTNIGVYGGATSSTLTLTNPGTGRDGYLYRCFVNDAGGCNPTTTASATLTVYGQVSIGSSPSATSVCSGSSTSFSASATAHSGSISYQWQSSPDGVSGWANISDGVSSGTTFSGSATATLTISTSTTNYNNYYFRANVQDACGTVNANTTGTAKLTVYSNVGVTGAPSNITVCAGGTASFTSSGNSQNGGLQYQWQQSSDGGATWTNMANGTGTNGTIAGVTTNNLTITSILGPYSGYQFRCILFDNCGTATQGVTSAATVTVNTPVTISANPSSPSAVCPSPASNVSISGLSIAGTSPTYQWQVSTDGGSTWSNTADGAVYSGSVAAALTILKASVSTSMNGNKYRCVASSGVTCGSPVTSGSATLTVYTNVSIGTQPIAAQTLCPGVAFTASVVASGTGGFSYQWNKGGTPISGATGASFSIASVAAADAASYTVTVSGACGSPVTSSNSVLNISTNVGIGTQPTASQTLCPGAAFTASVVASGTGGFSYQWKKNGTAIGGATASTYSITSVTATDAATYTVTVSGACGSPVTSSNSVLNISTNVGIGTQPTASQTLCPGAAFTASVVASGTGGFSYQWKKNGTAIGGATASTYSIASVAATDAATYTVTVSGACGSPVTSSNSVLAVSSTLTVTAQPSFPGIVCLNGNATLTANATGTGVTYQWLENGTAISNTGIYSGATTNTLTLTSISNSFNGKIYSCKFIGTCSTTTSNTTTLSLTTAPTITVGPSSATACANSTASLSVTATGTSPTYQWQNSSSGTTGTYSNISGATSATYTLSGVSLTTATSGFYQAVVSNSCGNSTSSVASLTVNPVTSISSQPVNASICPGQSGSISLTTGGTPTIAVQWQFDPGTGTFSDISGATGNTVTVTNASTANAGKYRAVVHSGCGTDVTSASATLTVNPTPAVPTVSDVSRCGDGAISTTASSSAPTPSFNWYQNLGDITPIYTGATYSFANLTSNSSLYVTDVSLGCESAQQQVDFKHFTPSSVGLGGALTLCLNQGKYDLSNDIVQTNSTGGTFSWKDANNVSYSGNSFDPTIGAGTYTITYVPPPSVQVSPNCYITSQRTVTVISSSGSSGISFLAPTGSPEVNSGNSINTCAGDNALNLSDYTTPTGGSWQTLQGNGISGNGSSVVFTPSINNLTTPSIPNQFQYTVSISGCTGSAVVSIFVSNNSTSPVLSGLPAVVCPGTKLNIGATVNTTGTFDYNWYDGQNALVSTGASYPYKVTKDTTLFVRSVNSPFGCVSPATPVNVVTPFSLASIGVDKSSIAYGDKVDFTYTGSTNGISYLWNFGDGGFPSTDQNPEHPYYKSGTFTVNLTLTSTLNCSKTLSYSPVVVAGPDLNVVTGDTGPQYRGLNVFPIPVKDQLSITSENSLYTITVYDMQGRPLVVKDCAGLYETYISTGSLASGLYILLVQDSKSIKSVKIVRE